MTEQNSREANKTRFGEQADTSTMMPRSTVVCIDDEEETVEVSSSNKPDDRNMALKQQPTTVRDFMTKTLKLYDDDPPVDDSGEQDGSLAREYRQWLDLPEVSNYPEMYPTLKFHSSPCVSIW